VTTSGGVGCGAVGESLFVSFVQEVSKIKVSNEIRERIKNFRHLLLEASLILIIAKVFHFLFTT
jgi:hypothetical protein